MHSRVEPAAVRVNPSSMCYRTVISLLVSSSNAKEQTGIEILAAGTQCQWSVVSSMLSAAVGSRASADCALDAIRSTGTHHRATHPARFATRRTARRPAISRSLSRLAAKKRPNSRPVRSFSSRTRQLSAVLPNRSKIPASSADRDSDTHELVGRTNRPAHPLLEPRGGLRPSFSR